jgi:hypothetical protein
MDNNTLRILIREMLEKQYEAGEEMLIKSEQKLPNSEDLKAIAVKGEPGNVKLNTLVKNPKMNEKGAKPHVNAQDRK